MIGILFRGKPQGFKETGWEPFTNEPTAQQEPVDETLGQEWAVLVDMARKNGFKVDFTKSGISMKYGESEGLFQDPRRGLDLAKRFVRDCLKSKV